MLIPNYWGAQGPLKGDQSDPEDLGGRQVTPQFHLCIWENLEAPRWPQWRSDGEARSAVPGGQFLSGSESRELRDSLLVCAECTAGSLVGTDPGLLLFCFTAVKTQVQQAV